VTRKQKVTRAVYAAYVILVTAFVGSSIYQVALKVFAGSANGANGANGAGAADERPTVGAPCGASLAKEIAAIDAARVAASTEVGLDAAKARYAKERAFSAASGEPRQSCSADPQGEAALAALARLDRASEANAIREGSELSTVRLTAQSFIRGLPR
jgi:hypothetical protein